MGFRQIAETMRAGTSHHFIEVARRVERLEFVVQQIGVRETFVARLELGQHPGQHAVGGGHLLQEVDHAARLEHLGVGGGAGAAGQQHGVTHRLLGLPARIDVVAQVGHALGSHHPAERRQDRVLHVRGHPAVHAVSDDEVELPKRGQVHPRDVAGQQLQVAEPNACTRARPRST